MGFRKSKEELEKQKKLFQKSYPDNVSASPVDPTQQNREVLKAIKEKILDVAVKPDSQIGKSIAERRAQEKKDALSKNALSPELMNKAYDLFPSLNNIIPNSNLSKFETPTEPAREIASEENQPTEESVVKPTSIKQSLSKEQSDSKKVPVEDSIETSIPTMQQPSQDEALLKAQQLQTKLEGQHGVARAMSDLLQSVTLGGKKSNADLSQYDDLIKRAGQPVRDIKEQREQEEVLTKLQTDKAKADPKSPVSEMARKSLEQIAGVKVPEGTSLKQIEVIYPYITQAMTAKNAAALRAQMASETRMNKEDAKLDDQFNKFVQKMNVDVVSPRTGIGRENNRLIQGSHALRLVEGVKSEKVTPMQKRELAISLATMLSPTGVPHESDIKEIDSDSMNQWIARKLQYITGKPQATNSPKLVDQLIKSVKNQMEVSKGVVDKYHRTIEHSYSHLKKKDPERFEEAKRTVLGDSLDKEKTIVRKGYNSKTNETQFIYSDGTTEIKPGKL